MSASLAKPYECLICATPIYNTNLGIDACRACTVFYRRHVNSTKKLQCRKGTDNCAETKARPLCRKCRFERFTAVLALSTNRATTTALLSQIDSTELDDEGGGSDSSDEKHAPPSPPSHAFMDHRSFSLLSVAGTSGAPFFERMKSAYSMLCMVRHCGEAGTREENATSEKEKNGDGILFLPTTRPAKMANARILAGALVPFYDAVFDDFRALSPEGKLFMISKGLRLTMTVDGLYRSIHHFPHEDVFLPSYTLYFSWEMINEFVEMCCVTEADKQYLLNEMHANFARMKTAMLGSYKRMRPANEEFLALLSLCLWNNELSRVNEEYGECVARNRKAVLAELHKWYAAEGVRDYSARLGDLLCMLSNVEKTTKQCEEDLEVVKLMATFKQEMGDLKC